MRHCLENWKGIIKSDNDAVDAIKFVHDLMVAESDFQDAGYENSMFDVFELMEDIREGRFKE